jgi:hypothetical protein
MLVNGGIHSVFIALAPKGQYPKFVQILVFVPVILGVKVNIPIFEIVLCFVNQTSGNLNVR